MQKQVRRVAILLFWLLVWQVAVIWLNNPLVLVGPIETIEAFFLQVGEMAFWQTVAGSAGRIVVGFLLAFAVGVLAGGMASRFPVIREILEPMVALMRAMPVASLVILVLILVGVEGFAAVDPQRIEMAQVFRLPVWKRLLYLYRPALWPSLLGGCKTALGMSWKSGVAAEVIGIPDFSIGAELYMAKIYFDTARLFAWTLVIILLSLCFERTFLWIMKQVGRPFGGLLRAEEKDTYGAAGVNLQGESKQFGAQIVLRDLHLSFKPGAVVGVMAPSGAGKTTLFRILMGLERVEAGEIGWKGGHRVTAAFQEDCLCSELTAEENAKLAGGVPALEEILPEEAVGKKAGELSGGMKRRVAVARAMSAPGDLVLLDEPFSGLDEATKEKVMEYVLNKRSGRTLLFTTHDSEDVKKMQADLLELPAYKA